MKALFTIPEFPGKDEENDKKPLKIHGLWVKI
jgi:hypothetical protein